MRIVARELEGCRLQLAAETGRRHTWNLYAKSGDTYTRVPDDVVIACARQLVEYDFHMSAAQVVNMAQVQGGSTPSTADTDVTYNLFRTLGTVGVELVDHLIIGQQAFSFAERNCLNECWLRAHAQC